MDYQTFEPHPDLSPIVKYYWTLEVPYDPQNEKQKIIPDGDIEMTFNLADNIKRYTSDDDFILNPSAAVMGQRTVSYYIEPIGNVESFAICFYPFGFANLIDIPLKELTDREAPLEELFGATLSRNLHRAIIDAQDTQERIKIIEEFLFNKLKEQKTTDTIVRTTIDAMLESKGASPIKEIIKNDKSKRRQLERKFSKLIGLSPKQLGKVIRMQAALQLMLNDTTENLTHVAYESGYYDQAHFIKDFKEFTEINPSSFLEDRAMELSSLFYK